jgi:hypothetical protein
MQFLLDYAAEFVRPLAEAALALRGVQGIVLEPDPLWLRWLALTDYAGRSRAGNLVRYWDDLLEREWSSFEGPQPWLDSRFRKWVSPDFGIFRQLTLSDLKDVPKEWEFFSRRGAWPDDARDPIIVKVRLRPDCTSEDRSRLTELPQLNRLRVVFETHPLAVFHSGPCDRAVPLIGGVSVGVGIVHDGTLGGIVKNASQFFGITCSHVVPNNQDVVEQPAKADSSSAAMPIGSRTIGTRLISSKITDPCNAYATTTPINSLDVALVHIDVTTSVKDPPEILQVGTLVGGVVPRELLNPGQLVEFSGKKSGHKHRVLRGVGVPYRVTDRTTGNIHCFQHLLVFQSTNDSAPSKQGDSGAWLCIQYGTGMGWAGMIIGGDGPDGYAIFASDIEKWWQAEGYSFSLL